MALGLNLNQKLSQSLKMTPQLRQAITMLQLGRVELKEALEKELLENPLLENAKEYEASEITSSSDDWSKVGSGEFKSKGLENQIESEEGLSSHLLWQLRSRHLTQTQEIIAHCLIGNLDRDGYLRASNSEISKQILEASSSQVSNDEVEEVLLIIHTLDPCGVGARNLSECLSIQFQQLGMQETLAYSIVENHLSLIEQSNFSEIEKIESVTLEKIKEAVAQIRKLDPQPGRTYSSDDSVYIVPDIYVKKNNGKLSFTLNEQGLPKLRLSSFYQDLLKGGKGENAKFFKERLKSATWLIRSIDQRQRTIFRVTQCIFRYQSQFLEEGVSTLKPLTLKVIAKELGLHESTISRVTSNKYVHTFRGVFELKYFFNSGLMGATGVISSESVRERIEALIKDENSEKPYSDQALVNQLKTEGTEIARRTVAKYRESLGIPSSSKRKKKI